MEREILSPLLLEFQSGLWYNMRANKEKNGKYYGRKIVEIFKFV